MDNACHMTFQIGPWAFCALLLLTTVAAEFTDSYRIVRELTLGEPNKFLIRDSKSSICVNVTYSSLQSVHDIINNYSFLTPSIQLECDCSCTQKNKTRTVKQVTCISSEPPEMRFDSRVQGRNKGLCPKWFDMLCEVTVSGNRALGTFQAFRLEYAQPLCEFSFTVKHSSQQDGHVTMLVNARVKKILLPPDILIGFPEDNTPEKLNSLSDGWYAYSENSGNLLAYDRVNNHAERDVDKLGWFRLDSKSSAPCLDEFQIKKHLQIRPLRCNQKALYEWSFNSPHYARDNLMYFPETAIPMAEKYGGIFSSVSTNANERRVIAVYKNPPPIKVSVSRIRSNSKGLTFIYEATLTVEQTLQVTFRKGRGEHRLQVLNSKWDEQYLFTVRFYGASVKHPVHFERKFQRMQMDPPKWICVYQKSEQICQMLESNTSIDAPATKVMSLSNSLIINSIIPLSKITCFVLIFLLILTIFVLYRQKRPILRAKYYSQPDIILFHDKRAQF